MITFFYLLNEFYVNSVIFAQNTFHMKKIILLSITYLFIITGFSQQIEFKLKSGDFNIPNKLTTDIFENGEYRMLFFSEIPTNQKLQLERIGVEFLYYLPPNIFVVYLNNNLSDIYIRKV